MKRYQIKSHTKFEVDIISFFASESAMKIHNITKKKKNFENVPLFDTGAVSSIQF